MSAITEAEKLNAEAKNLLNVEKLVRRSEHPNPLVLVIIIIVIIVVMYVLHTMFLKLSLSGEWRDADDN
jgi:t-SNARE complex subunit (syntaxin)